MRTLHRHEGTVRFFRNHPRQAATRIGRRELRRARVWVRIILRELAETRAQLKPRNPWTAAWFAQALCIHSREGAWNAATGNGYEGGLQFLESTWRSVGGRAIGGHWASVASPREQLLRAWLVWRRDGGSWAEWGTAGMCGLR